MAEAVGISHLHPAVPIMNFFAMVSMLLLVPAFWKTKIVALVALVGWLFVGNLINFIGMVHWRGRTDDALALASLLVILRRAKNCGYFTSLACFAHFTWQRLQPLPVRKLYDTRRRNNLIHLFFTLILPLLWTPLSLFSCQARYIIIEDFGPDESSRYDWPGFVAVVLPLLLGIAVFGIFNVLALVSYWKMKREDTDSGILKSHSSVRTRKLLTMTVINIGLAVFCLYVQTSQMPNIEWATPLPLTENIASLQTVLAYARSDLDAYYYDDTSAPARGAIAMPLLAFYVFAWFGLGEEARKAYGEALLELGRLVGVTHREHRPHPSTLSLSWPTIAVWKTKLQQWLADALSLIQPNAPQITPYISSVPPDDEPQVPTSPTRIQPSNSVGNRIDNKRQGRVPSKEPARRLSIHKPSLADLNPANTISSTLEVPLRRLSYHKPRFVPSALSNAPATATPGASGSTPPRTAAASNTGRQETFAPLLRPRRLSYHKPAFVPLTSVNANSAMEPTIPLAEIPMDIISERNAVLQAESVVEGSVVRPPLSSISTFTPPPPFSTPSTIPLVEIPRDIMGEENAAGSVVESTVALPSPCTSTVLPSFSTLYTTTSAPPYQRVDPFLERTL